MKRVLTFDLSYDSTIGTPVIPDSVLNNVDSLQVIVNAVFPIYCEMWKLYYTHELQPLSGLLANTITNTFSRLCRERAMCTGIEIYSVDLPLDAIATQLKCIAAHKNSHTEVVMKFLTVSSSTSLGTNVLRNTKNFDIHKAVRSMG